MLDGLEAADRAAELDPRLRVLDRCVEHALRPAHLLGRQRHRGKVEGLGQPGFGAAVGTDERRGGGGELQPRLLAGLVHGREVRARQAGRVTAHRKEGHALGRPRRHHDQVRHMPVDHEHLVSVEHPAVALLRRRALDATEVPLAVVLGDGQRGDRLTRRQAREHGLLGVVVARGEQRVGGQRDGGEERRAQQCGTHLLEYDRQLDVREAGAPELLGDGQRLESELVGHLAPDGGVVPLGRVHQTPDLGLGRLLGEEPPDRSAKLFLLLTEREIHCPGSSACFPRQPAGGSDACSAVSTRPGATVTNGSGPVSRWRDAG